MSTLSWSATPAAVRTAGVAALLGFFVSCSSSSTRTSGGRLVECSYTDVGALAFGAVAIIAGIVGAATCFKRSTDDRVILIAVAVVSVAIGVVHLLRGVGTIGGPCN